MKKEKADDGVRDGRLTRREKRKSLTSFGGVFEGGRRGMKVKIFKQVEDMKEARKVIAEVEEIEKAHSGNYALDLSIFPKSERFGSGFISKDSACHALRGREGREIFLPAKRRLQETDGQPDS